VVNMKKKVLIVDDDVDITKSVSDYLDQMGYHVTTLNTPDHVLASVEEFEPDIIILDIILPGGDGLTLCRLIRQLPTYFPIILLTTKTDVIDKVVGLEIGADDYITKPFSLREIEARIKAVLRRSVLEQKSENSKRLSSITQFGNIVMDVQNHIFKIEDKKIELTPKEFDLMKLFLSNPGKAFSRDKLLEKVWGASYKGYHRTVDSHINRLRIKIEKSTNHPQIITTIWGVGYKLNETYDMKK